MISEEQFVEEIITTFAEPCEVVCRVPAFADHFALVTFNKGESNELMLTVSYRATSQPDVWCIDGALTDYIHSGPTLRDAIVTTRTDLEKERARLAKKTIYLCCQPTMTRAKFVAEIEATLPNPNLIIHMDPQDEEVEYDLFARIGLDQEGAQNLWGVEYNNNINRWCFYDEEGKSFAEAFGRYVDSTLKRIEREQINFQRLKEATRD